MKESYSYVICENENQANDIRLTYKKQPKKNTLNIPKIETLDIWLSNAYQEYLMEEITNEELYVLNGIEEKIIWEKIIKDDLKKRQDDTVADITNIAQQAVNANRIISTYDIDETELKQNITYKEPRYFFEWRQNFKNECVKKSLTTKYDFINIFTVLQQEKKIIKDEKILFINLDTNKKSHQKLFNQLKKVNIVKNDLDDNKLQGHINHKGYQNFDHEISAVIAWIKEKLSKNQKKLLIMSPALERFQVKLQNKLDRNIQPIIFKDIRSESIANSSLKRPLSSEPIIRAALILIKLNEEKLLQTKEICEILLFNNWIDDTTFISRQYLAHQISGTKKQFISLFDLQDLLKKPLHMSQNEDHKILQATFNIIRNNRKSWHKKQKAYYWSTLITQYLKRLNFGKVNNLLYFENNNLKYFFKVINHINSSKIISQNLTLNEYYTYLEYYLENFIPTQPNEDAFIDIYGFYENPTKNYDAIWLMNMNDNFWPNKEGFNPFLSKKLQDKYNLFNDAYNKYIYTSKIERLSKLTPELTISFALKDNDTLLSASLYKPDLVKIFPFKEKKSLSLIANQHFIDDYQATPIKVVDEIMITSGRTCLENQKKCPAWAFYANRLGCSVYEVDDQDEVSRSAEGILTHRALELFWGKFKSLDSLLSIDTFTLEAEINNCISIALKEFASDHDEIDSRLLFMQRKHLENLLLRWLSEEKKRPKFSINNLEMWAEVKINKIKFKVRIDRIDNIYEKYHLLIDYKTGKQPTTRKALFSDDLTDLQIPIYACFVPIDNLNAVAIGHISRNKINLYGITSPNLEKITKQLCSKIDHPNINNWESLLSLWKKRLEKLAEQYLSGDVSVTFNEKIDFTYCDILPLLRLAEKKYQFEKYE
tara:strand:- start:21545 stop:24187 length:2643 start_codon:yes stop_codon:yes gene_type:complete